MALNPVNIPQKKKSGGLFGKVLGGIGAVGGGVAGAFAGGPLGAIKGASTGAGLGKMVGDVVDPAKGGQQQRGVGLSRMADDPEVKLAQLAESRKALMESAEIPEPDRIELEQNVFNPAMDALKKRLGRA